jgi:tetratricopeptide (TPR) repeat protein
MKGKYLLVPGTHVLKSLASSGTAIRFWLVVLLYLRVVGTVWGQTALVDKAYEFAKKKELQKAREALDQAVGNEATLRDPRAWYLRGYVYSELYKVNPTLESNLREMALESLQKSQRLDSKGTYRKDNKSVARYLHISYYNEAIQQYNLQDYDKALIGLKKFIQLRATEPADESYAEALYYAGYTSVVSGNNAEAKEFYEKALQLKYRNPLLYNDLGTLYEEIGKDSLAMVTVSQGRQAFPTDTTLRLTELNMLLYRNNLPKAEKMVEEYLQLNPSNTEVIMVAGLIYEKRAEADTTNREKYFNKRKEAYKRMLALNPNSFPANYNLGITIYNRGVEIIKSQQYDLDIVVLYDLLEKVSALFREAKPFVEKAYDLSPTNINAMRALEGIYYNLNEREKSRQIRAKINGMK